MLLLKLNNMQNHYDLKCSKLFHGKSKQVPMKKIRPLRCLPLLLLAFATALPASASEPATPKVVTPRPELTAANEEAERLGQTVYQVLLADVLQTFLREGRTRVGEFLQALEREDFPAAEQKSNALRGMAGNIRAEGVRVLAEMAEQACRRSRADKAASLGEEIMQELWRVEQAAALV